MAWLRADPAVLYGGGRPTGWEGLRASRSPRPPENLLAAPARVLAQSVRTERPRVPHPAAINRFLSAVLQKLPSDSTRIFIQMIQSGSSDRSELDRKAPPHYFRKIQPSYFISKRIAEDEGWGLNCSTTYNGPRGLSAAQQSNKPAAPFEIFA